MRDERFNVEELRMVSTAGAGLLNWVLAMVAYFIIARNVEPKRKKLADAELNLSAAMQDLAGIKVHRDANRAQLLMTTGN